MEIGESVLSQVFLPDIVMLVGQSGQEGMSREIIYVDLDSYDCLGLERLISKQMYEFHSPSQILGDCFT